MAKKQSVSFSPVFLVVATAVVVLFAGQAQGVDICAQAEYVPLCRSVVKGASDPTVAIKTAIQHLSFETKRAKTASSILGNKQAIDACTQNYDSALDNLQKSLEYLQIKDLPSLRVMLSGALSFYVSCTDAVAEVSTFGVVKMAKNVEKTDTALQHLAGNCLHIASLLK
ncbi:pectinesterase inhibitor-like [Cucumis melo var. makuwa]|uniref:Uncharacterized protein LOC103488985 n=2 Tax=Cucumis melo TaxID=3656 RepID=A0A1S3BF44_CUCME|nr:uncharacterized protein LOC103488985 [Cucumis melo]KAA0034294.1 pectinesterase inhibitor-like [Cucumis melo var. makuwa]TYK15625.1 pectinesterase inhibitor-like [Cucumis melo var. makuwa]